MRRAPSRLLPGIVVAALSVLFSASIAAGQTTLSTTLSGGEEVPPSDPNSKGWIALSFEADGTVCYEAKIQAIQDDTLVAGHIHQAAFGVNGPVFVDLQPTAADRHGNVLSNCVTATPEQVAAILAAPTSYYVNFHTDVYPGGALRGQLGD